MSTLLITARLTLAAVFVVAAIAKVLDRTGSRRALEDFAVPAALIPAATLLLPVTEALAAVLLVVGPTAQVGGVLAAALLLLFVGGIVAALRRGTAPECHCFGQLHSRPAGNETIGRNLALTAVSLFVLLAGPGPKVGTWFSHTSGQVIALAATSLLAVGLGYGAASLWRENRQLRGLGRRPGLPVPIDVGQPMPSFDVTSLDGTPMSSNELVSQARRSVLVFTSATCGPCLQVLPELAQWREMLQGRLDIHVLASGDPAENARHSEEHGMPVLLDKDGSVAQAFGIMGTPSAVEVEAGGLVATPAAMGAPAIEGAIRAALRRPAEATELVEVRHLNGSARSSGAGVAT